MSPSAKADSTVAIALGKIWLVSANKLRQAKVKGGMNLANKKNQAQRGQALIEYTLLLMMVTMVFWVGIKNSDMSQQMAAAWSRVSDCVGAPAACDSGS